MHISIFPEKYSNMVVNASHERTSLHNNYWKAILHETLLTLPNALQARKWLSFSPRLSRRFDIKIALEDTYFSPQEQKKSNFASLADRNSIFCQSNCPLENNQIPRSQGSSPAVQSMVFPGYHLTLHSTLCERWLGNWCKMLILLLLWEIALFLTQDKNLFVLSLFMKPLSWLISLQVGENLRLFTALNNSHVF